MDLLPPFELGREFGDAGVTPAGDIDRGRRQQPLSEQAPARSVAGAPQEIRYDARPITSRSAAYGWSGAGSAIAARGTRLQSRETLALWSRFCRARVWFHRLRASIRSCATTSATKATNPAIAPPASSGPGAPPRQMMAPINAAAPTKLATRAYRDRERDPIVVQGGPVEEAGAFGVEGDPLRFGSGHTVRDGRTAGRVGGQIERHPRVPPSGFGNCVQSASAQTATRRPASRPLSHERTDNERGDSGRGHGAMLNGVGRSGRGPLRRRQGARSDWR